MNLRTSRFLVLGLFFLSGFAALLYQVIWQRLLVFYTGSDTVSISLIVSAFMSGLGLGYLVGGQLADRSTPGQNLRWFVLAESGILLFAAISKWFLYDYLYQSAPAFGSPLALYATLFGALLLPTFLMGVSLPVLSRAFKFNEVNEQSNYVNLLYFINTLGAALGALVTGFVLVRRLGYDNAIWVGVVLNAICAGVGFLFIPGQRLARSLSASADKQPATDQLHTVDQSVTRSGSGTMPLSVWSVQYFLSGLAALSLELMWFRMLDTVIKAVSLTFAVLLAIYLGSMALGTLAGTRFGKLAAARRERLFLWAQVGLYSYVAFSVAVFVNAIGRVSGLTSLWQYLESGEPILSPRFAVLTYGAVPIFLLAVPTFLMGLSFALSQSLIQDDADLVGRRLGWLQFVNIVGSAAGAWLVTWLGFPLLGTATLFKVVGSLALLYLSLVLIRQRVEYAVVGAIAGVVLLALVSIPANNEFWQRLNGLSNPACFVGDENESAISVIKRTPDLKSGVVFVNGLGQSGLPFQTDEVHTLLGALPLMLHPNPERVAVIGLGSGGTVNGIAGRPETRQIDCYEIATNQAKVLEEYASQAGDTAILALLGDSRLRLLLRDGRYALRNRPDRYDIIEADALRPNSAYSGNVYSREYFEVAKSRLRPGGYAVTWCPTPRVLYTFRQVFPVCAVHRAAGPDW